MATINLFPNDTVQVDTLVDANGAAVGGRPNLDSYTVATAPTSGNSVGDLIYVTNGNNGQPAVAVWDGSNWKAVNNTNATINAGGGS